jgi:amino acid transporter
MFWKQLFRTKSLETLLAEAAGDNRLRRVLGPIALTCLGIGAIIGSGIFVMTGRVAAQDAGPAIMLSFVVAGLGCLFAALCYAEFASMAPVAGSAYTYAYATLGELLAWIIGWDLILEYAMACACVAAGWSHYLNEFLYVAFGADWKIPAKLCSDPFSTPGAWLNLPALLITLLVTVILVIGIRESATTNAILVGVKVGVVIFVICVGIAFVSAANWTEKSPTERIFPEEQAIPELVREDIKSGALTPEEAKKRIDTLNGAIEKADTTTKDPAARAEARKKLLQEFYVETAKLPEAEAEDRARVLSAYLLAKAKYERKKAELTAAVKDGKKTEDEKNAELAELTKQMNESPVKKKREELLAEVAAGKTTLKDMNEKLEDIEKKMKERGERVMYPVPENSPDVVIVDRLYKQVEEKAKAQSTDKWGILGLVGLNSFLEQIDDRVRSPFMPYGLAGIVFGASIVFFAYIGFDSISTHSEEAVKPQRDVPIGILSSLVICTVLYIAVAAVLTGMVPYYKINPGAAVASAFTVKGEEQNSPMLKGASLLISTGALAGLTSVLLITFLSQARIFLAMARDRLLPPAVFGAIHHKFRTPHISTMLTGAIISVVAALTPITKLEEMVNIGTLMAFVIVCGAVWMLRVQNPNANRPFRTPLLHVVAPLGIGVNLIMMLFLPLDTWIRLVVWLVIGLCIYFGYGMRRSALAHEMPGKPGSGELDISKAIDKDADRVLTAGSIDPEAVRQALREPDPIKETFPNPEPGPQGS